MRTRNSRRTDRNNARLRRTGTPRGTTTVLTADMNTAATARAPATKARTAPTALMPSRPVLACRTGRKAPRSAGENRGSRRHGGGQRVPLGGHHLGHGQVDQAVDHEAVAPGGAEVGHRHTRVPAAAAHL